MSETRVIYINADEADLMQSYLDSGGEDEIGTVHTYTTTYKHT